MDDPYSETRLAVVREINAGRAAAGLSPVTLDPLASQVSDRHCQEMAARGYLSHWNLQGLLPYHRYHFAGGRDHVQENLSEMTIVSRQPFPISTQPQELLPHLLNSHRRMIEEKPPLDGHRRNILGPGHTHAGIGLAVVGHIFTMAQLFLNRYVRLGPLPDALPRGPITVEGEMLDKTYGPYYCAVFYEGTPQPRRIEDLKQTYDYPDAAGDLCGKTPPWEMRHDPARGRFQFQVAVRNLGPGYYHLLLWVSRPVRSIPYQPSGAGAYQIDTKNGIPCAGWIFRH